MAKESVSTYRDMGHGVNQQQGCDSDHGQGKHQGIGRYGGHQQCCARQRGSVAVK